MAEYLLAEVLGRQPKQVRRLLVRTSVLERVNGELADLLTAGSGGGRILRELEQANAFVLALDSQRSWFHYHTLFADLLQLELLDTTAQDELARLHGVAAAWFGEHGSPSRRYATLRRPRTGAWPAACCPITGSASPSTARPPPRTTCCAAFPKR